MNIYYPKTVVTTEQKKAWIIKLGKGTLPGSKRIREQLKEEYRKLVQLWFSSTNQLAYIAAINNLGSKAQ